jgi:hypothetical protein
LRCELPAALLDLLESLGWRSTQASA